MKDRLFESERLRSAGVLDAKQRTFCRKRGIPLAYAPRQIGWVLAGCRDDFTEGNSNQATARDGSAPDLRTRANEHFDVHADTPLAGFDSRGGELSAVERALFRRRCRSHADRYILRAWRKTDLPQFRVLLDDPQVWRHLPEPYPDPLDDDIAQSLIELSNDSSRHDVRAIVRAGELVGQIRLEFSGRHTDRKAGDAEISYWLGARHWGQGIMSEVVPLFTLRCFERHPVQSIFARVAEDNIASSRLLEKSNYRDEGSLRSELDPEPGTRTYRTFRRDYVGERPAAGKHLPYSGAVATR